jgi:23S rRNA pseudouridine955/2504/2580 synthase
MLRKKNLKLNNHRIIGNEILLVGDELKVFMAEETLVKFQSEFELPHIEHINRLVIVYEDKNFLICNKPVGLIMYGAKDSILNRVLSYLHFKGDIDINKHENFVPAFCNRLDRNTSGLVVCAKTLYAAQEFSYIFSNRLIDKYYLAIVKGTPPVSGILNGYMKKDEYNNKVDIVDKERVGYKNVLTEYTTLKTNSRYSLLEVKLVTGKTHQIRAQLSRIGHPILGDPKYGNIKVNEQLKDFNIYGQLLHCRSFIFNSNLQGKLDYLSDKRFTCDCDRIKNALKILCL